MKRSALTRKTRIKTISERELERRIELEEVRPLIEARSLGVCEICRWATGVHLHHKLRRSQGGTNTLDNLLLVCSEDHEFIHSNPEQSYEKGWLIRSSRRRI